MRRRELLGGAGAMSEDGIEGGDVEVLVGPDRDAVETAVRRARETRLVVLHSGESTTPFGHWVLSDGLCSPVSLLSHHHRDSPVDLVVCSASPCDDWAPGATDKKRFPSLTACPYRLIDTDSTAGTVGTGTVGGDEAPLAECCPGITKLVERVSAQLTVSKISHNQDISSLGTVCPRTPALYAFVDKGSTAVPALLTLDGFAVLINCGFHRNSDLRRYLCLYNQLDVAILTHLSYSNLHGLTSIADCCDQQYHQQQHLSHRINHLLLPVDPASLSLLDQSQPDPPHPLAVDLRYHLGTAIRKLRHLTGMHCSELAFKQKSAVKVIQLYYKIGCGKLDLIPLCPFEDDSEVKKFGEEWKKGKYSNDSSPKSVPASSSVLLLWKPYNEKVPVKRVLYVGSKCSIKKYFPAAVTMLHASQDCLKQPEFIPADGIAKKQAGPRKPAPTAAAAPSGVKSVKSTIETTKPSSAGPTANTKKPPSRPVTATVTDGPSAPKESVKRPQTATGAKPKSEPVKQSQEGTGKKPASSNVSKPSTTTTAAVAAVASNKKAAPKTKPELKGRPTSNTSKSQHPPATAPAAAVKEKAVPLANGDVAVANKGSEAVHSNGIDATVSDHVNADHGLGDQSAGAGDIDVSASSGSCGTGGSKIVAVGTVECAITEHGEADFCDDTPEELSADQMRKMGLYGDEDEEREDDLVKHQAGDRVGNLAHLPMEGSFYGKEPIDTMTNPDDANHITGWSEPLALPVPPPPTKDASAAAAAAKKTPGGNKCFSPLFVDYLCVPSDLESRDELDCLFEYVRSPVIVAQIERPTDLLRLVEALLVARDRDGTAQLPLVTVIPNCPVNEDRAWLDWHHANAARLTSCAVTIATDLTHHSLSAVVDGGQSVGECRGVKFELV